MALTFTIVKGSEWTAGRVRGAYYDGVFTGTYPTGGETIEARAFGLLSVLGIEVQAGNAASAGLLYRFDPAASKLLIFYPSGGGTAAGTTLADPAITAGAVAVTSTAANGAADLTAGRGRELTNATVLTSVTIRCRIEGFQ